MNPEPIIPDHAAELIGFVVLVYGLLIYLAVGAWVADHILPRFQAWWRGL